MFGSDDDEDDGGFDYEPYPEDNNNLNDEDLQNYIDGNLPSDKEYFPYPNKTVSFTILWNSSLLITST